MREVKDIITLSVNREFKIGVDTSVNSEVNFTSRFTAEYRLRISTISKFSMVMSNVRFKIEWDPYFDRWYDYNKVR